MPDPTDTMIRDALIAYTGAEPPLTFTYEQVVGDGRRARRRRRIAWGGAATAVVAVAVAGFAVRGAGSPPPLSSYEVAGPSWTALDAAPSCATASAAPTGPLVEPTTVGSGYGYPIRIPAEPADHAAARLSCYLATAVPPLLPDVTYHRDATTPGGTTPLQAYPGRVFDPARPAETSPPFITASAVVTGARGAGTIGFGAGPAYESTATAVANCAGICAVRTGPHGETVTVLDVTEASGYHHVEVHVHRGDTLFSASAENGVTTPGAPGEAISGADLKPTSRDLPLTVDQLIALVCAPGLEP